MPRESRSCSASTSARGCDQHLAPPVPIPAGTWKTIKLLVHNYPTQPDGRGDVVVFVDGLDVTLPLPVGLQSSGAPRLNLGIAAARGPMETLRLNIDDVAITTYDGPDPTAP